MSKLFKIVLTYSQKLLLLEPLGSNIEALIKDLLRMLYYIHMYICIIISDCHDSKHCDSNMLENLFFPNCWLDIRGLLESAEWFCHHGWFEAWCYCGYRAAHLLFKHVCQRLLELFNDISLWCGAMVKFHRTAHSPAQWRGWMEN